MLNLHPNGSPSCGTVSCSHYKISRDRYHRKIALSHLAFLGDNHSHVLAGLPYLHRKVHIYHMEIHLVDQGQHFSQVVSNSSVKRL